MTPFPRRCHHPTSLCVFAVAECAEGFYEMTGRDIAIEFTEMWDDLDIGDINTMLAKNVSMELLEFFSNYAEQFAGDMIPEGESGKELRRRLPNLLVIGYIIRLLEERID